MDDVSYRVGFEDALDCVRDMLSRAEGVPRGVLREVDELVRNVRARKARVIVEDMALHPL